MKDNYKVTQSGAYRKILVTSNGKRGTVLRLSDKEWYVSTMSGWIRADGAQARTLEKNYKELALQGKDSNVVVPFGEKK